MIKSSYYCFVYPLSRILANIIYQYWRGILAGSQPTEQLKPFKKAAVAPFIMISTSMDQSGFEPLTLKITLAATTDTSVLFQCSESKKILLSISRDVKSSAAAFRTSSNFSLALLRIFHRLVKPVGGSFSTSINIPNN